MHIRCILADRFREKRIDEADDRRVVLLLQQVADFGHGFGQARQVHVVAEILDHLLRFRRVPRVDLGEETLEFVVGNGAHGEPAAGESA